VQKKQGKRQEKACLGKKLPRILACCLSGAQCVGRLADVPSEHSALTPGTTRLQNIRRPGLARHGYCPLQDGLLMALRPAMSPYLKPLTRRSSWKTRHAESARGEVTVSHPQYFGTPAVTRFDPRQLRIRRPEACTVCARHTLA
jgi:hypothetical protein